MSDIDRCEQESDHLWSDWHKCRRHVDEAGWAYCYGVIRRCVLCGMGEHNP